MTHLRGRGKCGLVAAIPLAGALVGFAPVVARAQDAAATMHWAVDPAEPGADLPPVGRSMFDAVIAERGPAGTTYVVPFPFEALRARLESRTGVAPRELLVPLGRSLQRNAANPDFFAYPRVVIAVDGSTAETLPARERSTAKAAWPLGDRLFLGYQERAAVIEVISYNEDAGRFEFQVVHDYRAGATPDVRYADRDVCIRCHQNHAPIFSRPLWDETNANSDVAALLAATGRDYYGARIDPGVDVAEAFDAATDRANMLAVWQRIWIDGCGADAAGARCRADALLAALRYRLTGGRHAVLAPLAESVSLQRALRANWPIAWPLGLAIPNPDVPNRRLRLFAAQRGPLDLPGALHGAPLGANDIAALVRVPPELEAFRTRAPLAVWRAADADAALVERFVAGVAQFFTAADVRALDRRLVGAALSASRTYTVPCRSTPQAAAGGARAYDIVCRSRDGEVPVELDATFFLDAGAQWPTTLHRFGLAGQDQLRGATGTVTRTGPGRLELQFSDAASGLRARLPAGDVPAAVTLTLQQAGLAGAAVLRVRLEQDFASLERAVAQLAAVAMRERSGALAAGPLRGRTIVHDLFVALGAQPPAACCELAAELPPPRRDD